MRQQLQQCENELARAKAELGQKGKANANVCLANANAPKDISCDTFLQELPEDKFNEWVAQIKDPKVRELLTIVHQYKKQRGQVRLERDFFILEVQPSIFKTNKIRSEKGLPLLPTDFATYFAQRELQARTLSSTKPVLKTTGKAPADFVRKAKTPSPKQVVEAPVTEKPKVGRLGPFGNLNVFAQAETFSLFDDESVRKFIVSQRQKVKSGRTSVEAAVEAFQRAIPPQERAQVPTPRLRQLEN